MGTMRATLAVGRFSGATATGLESASRAAGLEFNHVESVSEALSWLEVNEPHSLLLDGGNGGVDGAALRCARRCDTLSYRFLALAPVVNELAFAEVFSCGADDVVALRGEAALTARLRRLPVAPWERPRPAPTRSR